MQVVKPPDAHSRPPQHERDWNLYYTPGSTHWDTDKREIRQYFTYWGSYVRDFNLNCKRIVNVPQTLTRSNPSRNVTETCTTPLGQHTNKGQTWQYFPSLRLVCAWFQLNLHVYRVLASDAYLLALTPSIKRVTKRRQNETAEKWAKHNTATKVSNYKETATRVCPRATKRGSH